jgi:hypothetical protein
MTQSRRWMPLWAGLILTAVAGAAQWLLWTGGPTLRPGVGPFTLLTYLGLVALCNRTRMTVRPEGVELRRGPLPTGAASEWIPREQIAGGYWRWNVQNPQSGDVSHWEAGIIRRDGRWLRSPAHFATEMQAAQKTAAMLGILGLQQMQRVEGFPPKPDRRAGLILVFWMLLAFVALGSAVVLEYRR